MNIRNNNIEINKEKPFSNCKLGREQYALILTDIIQSAKDGFVLAIDNEWGTGKTTFVKMWKQHLENNDYKTLYYNAWENDFGQDVLVALISELNVLKTPLNEESFKTVTKKAGTLVKSLGLGLLKTQISKYVGDEVLKEALNQTANTIADGFQEQIEIYANKKKGIKDFKESLENFVSSSTEQKPVVFIIDELDRCRPNYAVELLEQLKHLFSVSGIVFVLSIDKIQLGNAVRGFYGSDLIDSDEYLRRFFDIEYSIPEPDTNLFCNYLYDYFQFDEFISNKERLSDFQLKNDKSDFITFSTILFNYAKLPLRVQEKILAHARLALTQFEQNTYLTPHLFILLIYLKIKHKEIYNSIKNQKYSLQNLIDNVESVLPRSINNSDLEVFLKAEASLLKTYNYDKDENLREKFIITGDEINKDKLSVKSNLDLSENNKTFFDIIKNLDYSYPYLNRIGISHFIKKIELIKQLK
jgi:hypothetical protein